MLNRSFRNKRVIIVASYSIDFVIVTCSIIKYACAAKGVREFYKFRHYNQKLREAYYIASIIMQFFQILMFILTVIILYVIRTMLSKPPVCQTGLCQSASSSRGGAQDDNNRSSSSDGIEVADNRSLLAS